VEGSAFEEIVDVYNYRVMYTKKKEKQNKKKTETRL